MKEEEVVEVEIVVVAVRVVTVIISSSHCIAKIPRRLKTQDDLNCYGENIYALS